MTEIYNVLLYTIMYLIYYINISFLIGKNKKLYSLLIGLILFIPSILISTPLRVVYQQIILIITFYLLNKNMKKVITAVMFNYFILLIVDILCSSMLILSNIKFDGNIIYITGLIISILSYILIRRKLILQLWEIIQKKIEKYVYFLVLIMLISLYISIGYRYEIINISVLLIFIIVLISVLIHQFVKNYIAKLETEMMIEYIEKYEKQIDEFRINQHEYKNILMCIKGMTSKDKKVNAFIDSVLMNNSKEDHDVLKDVLKVEMSPIKGLLYHKLLSCKEKNINFTLNVSANVNFEKLNKLDVDTLKDITMILGVFLDNAIEACEETLQKSLSIYLYEEDNIVTFQVSNTFKGILNIDLLYKRGYSTKGKNHGYGLSLAKERVCLNEKLDMRSEVHDDVFVQYLQINIKNI